MNPWFQFSDPALRALMSVHPEWSARQVRLTRLGRGEVLAELVWIDDGPAKGRPRNPNLFDAFIFNEFTSDWWPLQVWLYERLQATKNKLYSIQ